MRRWGISVCVLVVLLTGCASPRPTTVTPETAVTTPAVSQGWPEPESDTQLLIAQQPLPLEVGVVVFGGGEISANEGDSRHTLREVETQLLPAYLRDVLTESESWGPIRVLPTRSAFADVTLETTIVHSDGRNLVLDVKVTDATGRVWLDRLFRASADASDYDGVADAPFRAVFTAISNALLVVGGSLSDEERERIAQVGALQYAAELAPEAFGGYLEERDGRRVLLRLPSREDPTLKRVERIRSQEALFIDTIDEQFIDLRSRLDKTYQLWRRASFEQSEYLEDYTARASQRSVSAGKGSYAAMQQVYSTYRSVRIQEQDLFELAVGFDNETAPTVMESGGRVVRLTGTLASRYEQWRSILSQIIQLEQGGLQ